MVIWGESHTCIILPLNYLTFFIPIEGCLGIDTLNYQVNLDILFSRIRCDFFTTME